MATEPPIRAQERTRSVETATFEYLVKKNLGPRTVASVLSGMFCQWGRMKVSSFCSPNLGSVVEVPIIACEFYSTRGVAVFPSHSTNYRFFPVFFGPSVRKSVE